MFKKLLSSLFVTALIVSSLSLGLVQKGYGSEPEGRPGNLQIDISDDEYSAFATLTWDPCSMEQGTEGYAIYVNGAEKARVSETSYQFTDLAPYTEYSIYVKAYNSLGYLSEASDTLSVTTGYERMLFVGEGEQYTEIRKAVAAAKPGDVVVVRDGDYVGFMNFLSTYGGSEEKWITVMAEGENANIYGSITFNASYVRFTGFKMNNLLDGEYISADGKAIDFRGKHCQIVNLEIKNYPFGLSVIESADRAEYLYFADNYLYKCMMAIVVSGRNHIIERNEIEELDRTGRTLNDADYIRVLGSNVIIRNNYIHSTFTEEDIGGAHVDFIQSYAPQESKNVLVENNIFSGFAHQALRLSNGTYGYKISDWTIRNNIFTGFTSWGICAGDDKVTNDGVPGLIVENNLFVGDPNANNGNGAHYGLVFRNNGSTAIVKNNIIMNVNGISYGVDSGGAILEAGNNLIFNAPAPPVINPTDIVGIDPSFVDPDNMDFRLLPSSIAIDNGADVSFKYDLEGNIRPFGYAVDIGPYESEYYGDKINKPPVISITSPEAGQTCAVGSDISVTATVTDDTEPVKVEYFLNDEYIGESLEEPFNFIISGLEEGLYKLYGIAYDEEGLTGRSNEVMFFVSEEEATIVQKAWINIPFEKQYNIVQVTLDVVPLNEKDSISYIMGLSSGGGSTFGDLSPLVRFKRNGGFDAYNEISGSSGYFADNTVDYNIYEINRITIIADIPQNSYSAYFTDENGDIQTICTNYIFRKKVNNLDNISLYGEAGSFALLRYTVEELSDEIPADSVNITEEGINLTVGSSRALTATVLPEDATNKELEWTSSNTGVATVDADGLVTAVSEGTAVITVKVAGTEIQDTCTVTVEPTYVGEYDFTISDISIDKNAGVAVEAKVTSNTISGGNAVVIFKLVKNDGTVIGLTSNELYINDESIFKVKFHGYSGDEYKVKIYVWDKLDSSTEDIGENLAEPVEIQ